MSTVASPRPSITLSSRRTSVETTTSNTSKPAVPTTERGHLRRNRSALRDYYGIKKEADSPLDTITLDSERESEIDKPGFDPSSYVQRLLATEGLEGVLRVEAGLVSDIRSLDGEKKALVYDNYSKLIAATDTIKSMRGKMDPMTPTTSTLAPAIGHIAETASSLMAELKRDHGQDAVEWKAKQAERQKQQAMVRWVLATPQRIKSLREDGQDDSAREEWRKVEAILNKWDSVKGVEDVRTACHVALRGVGDG